MIDMDEGAEAAWPSRFLKTILHSHLLKRGLEIEIRCVHHLPEKPVVRRFYGSLSKFERAWREIVDLNRQGYNIFVGVVLRDPKTNTDQLSQRF